MKLASSSVVHETGNNASWASDASLSIHCGVRREGFYSLQSRRKPRAMPSSECGSQFCMPGDTTLCGIIPGDEVCGNQSNRRPITEPEGRPTVPASCGTNLNGRRYHSVAMRSFSLTPRNGTGIIQAPCPVRPALRGDVLCSIQPPKAAALRHPGRWSWCVHRRNSIPSMANVRMDGLAGECGAPGRIGRTHQEPAHVL